MPHRNPNVGARRSFGIKDVSIGRYRMLKDLNTGVILKTKSEVSALTDFISWLARAKAASKGVILLSHEPEKKVLVSLLIQALQKYNLLASFSEIVKGFCNSVDIISDLGDKSKITSMSLRSLCKTVLGDTSLVTASALDRARVLINIVNTITKDSKDSSLVKYSNSVSYEEKQLATLKKVLETQGTLRPIFAPLLKQNRLQRNRAMELRKNVAEAGIDYDALQAAFKDGGVRDKLTGIEGCSEDVDEMVQLVENYFGNCMASKGPVDDMISSGGQVTTGAKAVKEDSTAVENES